MTDMHNSHPVIAIVGAGMAGHDLAFSLRQFGWAGRIVLLGEEPHLPYRRPDLSKSFLATQADVTSLSLRPLNVYEREGIELRLNTHVDSIDRSRKTIRLNAHEDLAYDKLVLATGGRARPLPLNFSLGTAIHYLRSIEDALRLRGQFSPGKRLLIIGGGYVGLEVASVAREAGLHVALVEATPRLLARVASPYLSTYIENVHREAGVDVRLGLTVTSVQSQDGGHSVMLSDGSSVFTDIIVGGIGMVPETALAQAAGLETSNGIVVDEFSKTSDSEIYAIGDCCNQENGFLSRRVRLESVPNAAEQAKRVAAELTGKPIPSSTAPWFWSNQYRQKIQIVGLMQPGQRAVIRNGPPAGQFSVFHLEEGQIQAVECVNSSADFAQARRLVGSRSSALDHLLADGTEPLGSL